MTLNKVYFKFCKSQYRNQKIVDFISKFIANSDVTMDFDKKKLEKITFWYTLKANQMEMEILWR